MVEIDQWPCDDYQPPLTCYTVPNGPKHLTCSGCREAFPNGPEVQRLYRRPKVSDRRTDWGVRDDATGNVGTSGAYNRRATEAWLAELTEPSTLMRRERTIYADDVTEWVPVDLVNRPESPGESR